MMNHLRTYESWSISEEESFTRAIYLTYVERNPEVSGGFEHVTEEEFKARLYSLLVKTKDWNYSGSHPLYRLADEKTVWIGSNSAVLGEVWRRDGLQSYWIKK